MNYDYSKLLGKIIEICGTQSNFANKIQLSDRTVSLKLNGKVNWKQEEIIRACDALHIPPREIPEYFFNY